MTYLDVKYKTSVEMRVETNRHYDIVECFVDVICGYLFRYLCIGIVVSSPIAYPARVSPR